MNYRREIDGLRALAVLPVILFHAGFETFSGGFIGVDVFFVISGYLITTIILTEFEQSQFSLLNFYERRARRIIPALFLVMFVCVPVAWYLMLPSDMKEFSQSLIAVSVFLSNILFLRQSGYFDTAAELKPLLHTWSLGVEEQFYVFFPLFMMLFWKLGKRRIVIMLSFVFIGSLATAQWAVYAKPSAAFYLLPTRGWELLTGAFAAFYLSSNKKNEFSKNTRELGGCLGLALVLFAVFSYSKVTPFPGLYAIVPTLGTVLIILFVNQTTTVGNFVGNKAFVGIGLLSYSAYLWHQPLFAFARQYGFTHYDKMVFFCLSVSSLFLAYLSWKFVEAPFRNKTVISKKTLLIFTILGSIFFLTIGIYGYKKNGNVGQITVEQQSFLSHFENDIPVWKYFMREGIPEKFRTDCDFYDISKYRSGNATKVPIDSIAYSCYVKTTEKSKTIFIWGDSHVQQLYFGINKVLSKDFDLLQVASSGCVASIQAKQNKIDYCEQSNWFAYTVIKEIKPSIVIIGQNLGHDLPSMVKISDELKRIGVERVIFTGPSPHWVPSLPAVVARLLPKVPERTFSGINREVLELDKKLKLESSNFNNIEYISLIDFFCNHNGCLIHYNSDISNSVTSWDYGHLTPIASYYFAKDLLSSVVKNK